MGYFSALRLARNDAAITIATFTMRNRLRTANSRGVAYLRYEVTQLLELRARQSEADPRPVSRLALNANVAVLRFD